MLFTYLLIPLLFLFSPEKEKAPPGTVLVGKYYVDYQEITNINWLSFEFETGRQGKENRSTKPKYNFEYNHPDYRNLPITNITYEQALMYCEWRSKVVSEVGGRKVIYRLPTQEEWLEIVGETMGKHPKKLIKEFNKAKKSLIRPTALLSNSRINYPTQLFYNVSEMTATEGIAMGLNNSILEGSKWQDNLTHTFTYEEYSPFVGFRCIAEVEEKKAKKQK